MYFELFYPFVVETEVRPALVLMGLRRVGKTVMMYHVIEQLLKDAIENQKIFFTYIAYNTGNEFSYQTMAKESGIQKEVLKKYLEYLEAAFLIKVLSKVDVNAKRLKRVSSFKVYLTNPSLRTALFSPINATDYEKGNMVETAILSQWMHRVNLDLTYARWKE